MKANQKFMKNDDEAVSPVIAVILMVAITVVLAATVYVWVSGFGAQSTTPAKSIALTSAAAITSTDCDSATSGTQDCKSYTVASATSGMKYSDIKFVIAGTEYTLDAACATSAVGNYSACAGTSIRTSDSLVMAGDRLTFEAADGALSGKQLQVLDASANSVLLTLTIS